MIHGQPDRKGPTGHAMPQSAPPPPPIKQQQQQVSYYHHLLSKSLPPSVTILSKSVVEVAKHLD